MKHRSVSKVRSTKLAKKTRFIDRQLVGSQKPRLFIRRLVWLSNNYHPSVNDPQTGVIIPEHITVGNGTYSRAKHDVVDNNGITIKRYVVR